mmetsp:Transcript_36477/g.66262  ORF Transcript_36477/g.66262 Transcript_36477/m.66262 type:complete len:384 (+) Transcript_36477:113-1264(+)
MPLPVRCLGSALAAAVFGAAGGIRLNSQEYDALESSGFLSNGNALEIRHGLAGRMLLSFCDSEILGRLPYSACLLAVHLSGSGGVAIPHWTGARLGNDILQAVHAVIYAEALGLPEVTFPREGGNLGELFDMPRTLSIIPNPDLQRRVRCSFHASSDFFDGSSCQGVRRQDYRRALLRYFKPRLNSAAREACSAEAEGFKGLTIHLRSGDLLHSEHKQSHFLPCAFHDLAIEAGGFQEVRVVTEPDMAHPCLASLKHRHADKLVRVQSQSLAQDACALMTAQHLEFGDSTFAQVFEMMNENVKNVSMPRLLAGGERQWYAAGTSGDPMGLLAPCGGEDDQGRSYSLYSVAGITEKRRAQERMAFLLSTPTSALHSVQACVGAV